MNNRKKVVIITGQGFEDAEVIYPYYRLQEAGFAVEVVTSSNTAVKGKYGYPLNPTIPFDKLTTKDFHAIIIPGGYEAPDRVRQVKEILSFIRSMHSKNKIISSICHGPWVLISAGVIRGKNATCYIGMKDDLINAGANYQDKSVVIDGNLITSDHPRNLPVWMQATCNLLKQ